MTREQKIAEAKRLRGQGATYRATGEALGHPVTTIYNWLNPEYVRRSNVKRGPAKREWEAGTCPQCGGRLASADRSDRCIDCKREAVRRQARERAELFIALRERGLLNNEIAEREGITAGSVASALCHAPDYGLTVPRSPYFTRSGR